MKRIILLHLLLGLSIFSSPAQNTYENEWKEVESLDRKGLPQSALKIVDRIYAASKAENNGPQFLKAALYQLKLRSDYQEDFMETSLEQIGKEIEGSHSPVKQILHTIRAELYWRYYQGNRFKFMERTRVSNPDSEDIRTWDVAALVSAVSENYLASLEDKTILQKTALGNFDPILENEKGSRTFRPTLYDFLAHRALDFFMNEESGLTRPAPAFYIDSKDYFLPAAEFAAFPLKPATGDEFLLQSLHLLQSLIAFHLNDADPAALIDADLKRIRFVEEHAFMAERFDLYLEALKSLESKYSGHPNSTDASYEIALEYLRRGAQYNPFKSEDHRWDFKNARETCEKAIKAFPGSDGAQNCAILLDDIDRTSLSFTMHYANLPGSPFLASLSYQNISKVYFRVIPMDPEEDRLLKQKQRVEAQVDTYRRMTPVKSWTLSLPDAGDFQGHNTQVKIPDLPLGYYVILASDNPDFSISNQSVAFAPCWVTGLSFITETAQDDGKMGILVLDRQKGTTLAGVQVKAFVREYDYQTRSYQNRLLDSYLSDRDGHISIPAQANASKSFYLEFYLGNDRFFSENYFYLYPVTKEEKSRIITHFFTDRSIYRPGQTIYFKGIVLEKTGEKIDIKKGFSSLVTLYDANNQKVSDFLLTTNEFGSFNSAFTAPSGGLTGEMSIRSETGSVSFSVEEYKRPRFKVEIDSLEGNYKLNEPVTVTGRAMAYAGNAVDQATVTYRVVRMARFPVWRNWWDWFPGTPEAEILSGQTRTGPDGSFSLAFPAIPDPEVDPKFQPVFTYTIYTDVADMTGEVRSAETSVSVGYQALLLDVNIPEKLNAEGKNQFRLTATNLNNRPVRAEGKLTIMPVTGPSRLIRERSWARPDVFVMTKEEFQKDFPNALYAAENDPETWTRGKAVVSRNFNSASDSVISLENLAHWDEGTYLLLLESTDAFGQKVEVKKYFTVFDPSGKSMPENKPMWHASLKNSGEPGDTAVFVIGTAEKNGKIMFEVENKGKIISREWLELSQEKRKISIPILEDYRGNFFVSFVLVKENRSYQLTEKVSVPFTDRELKITTETFRDRLTPGQAEEWRIRITGMKGEKVAAELLASMYDASLDAFREHAWMFDLYPLRYPASGWDARNAFGDATSHMARQLPPSDKSPVFRGYDRLNWFGFNYYGTPYPMRAGNQMMMKNMDAMAGKAQGEEAMVADESTSATGQQPPAPEPPADKTQDVPVRRNFAETAFFFPSLMTDEEGGVILKFTVPESLTAWKLMMLAHTSDLKTGYLEKEMITQKDLMVMPNPPRFFREGDRMAFSAKVVSLAEAVMTGQVTAEFFNAYTMQPIDELLGNTGKQKDFSIEKGNSQAFFWEINIPEGLDAIVCRVKAISGTLGDGEEIVIPVLPNRMLVTESLPLPVSGAGTRNFAFDKLLGSGKSSSIKSYRLTLEFTSNPAWYAVQALPYLTESPHESADNLFSRYYANSLAAFIANSNPKIRQVFENWKNLSPDALMSNLEKNQELKAVLLNETPWVLEAKNETDRKKRLALLFDLNRMAEEQQSTLQKLQQMQAPNGGWPWFEGMPDNRYITQLIMTGIGKLQHLGVIDMKANPGIVNMVRRGFFYLNSRIKEDYDLILEQSRDKKDENHLSAIQVQYLYAYSFLEDFVEIDQANREAFEYFKDQATRYWQKQPKYIQGMIALALYRMGDAETPVEILNSIKEHALYSEEMGLYWRDEAGYYWHEAPVERQAMMIEAFSEVLDDKGAVEQMKIWLLKQKQTQDWKTTRATADAVYALLLKGTDLLASDQLVDVTVGKVQVDPLRLDGVAVEAGTGYYQVSWQGPEIKPEMGNVRVEKRDEGVAWGALYWQYYEHLDRITPAETPLSVEKEIYIERNTPKGPVLEQVSEGNTMKTGDKVKARIIIRVDRDMEYVHMKDMRAAAFEPADVLSGYRYQGGLGYYESIRDASVNFYFDYLRKGTYVFEYQLNVTQKGEFSNGITSIQCLYAPEFAAHSQGIRVKVE